MIGNATVTQCARALRACRAEFDLATAAVVCLGTLILAFTILTTTAMLMLALPYDSHMPGFEAPPDPGGTLVARAPSSTAAN